MKQWLYICRKLEGKFEVSIPENLQDKVLVDHINGYEFLSSSSTKMRTRSEPCRKAKILYIYGKDMELKQESDIFARHSNYKIWALPWVLSRQVTSYSLSPSDYDYFREVKSDGLRRVQHCNRFFAPQFGKLTLIFLWQVGVCWRWRVRQYHLFHASDNVFSVCFNSL